MKVNNKSDRVPLIDGGTIRLPAIIGLGRAMDMAMTGKTIDSLEAEKIGLINKIVKDGDAINEAVKLANTISQFPQGNFIFFKCTMYVYYK